MTDGTEHRLDEEDDGRVVSLALGDTVEVVLPENATTGYRWTPDAVGEPILTLVEDAVVPALADGVGAGGARRFRFRPRQPGGAELRLKLWRPWEGDASVRRRFSAHVQVRAQAPT